MNRLVLLFLLLLCQRSLIAAPPTCEAARAMFRAQGVPEDQWPRCNDSVGQPTTKQQPNCACDSPSIRTCKLVLDGFAVSSYDHPDLNTFSRQISNELRGGQIRRIEFKGFSDGTSDKNGAGDWSRVQVSECKRLPAGPYYDLVLGELRRCYVRVGVEKILGTKVSSAAIETQHDYPTDKRYAISALRKVEVSITRSEVCK
jgi:hypothetical protein